WGEKVFFTTNPASGWDGTFRGNKLDAAVFVYYLKANVNGEEVSKHGNITLVK
ncbi:MAG: gliding motility-associated C-terminal domain-containing protein, partial [Bacteroidia bacterium]|nr:gliding motility-associated C-terminal domain-containing protein [Bacteroidia bacterium]